MAGSRLLRARAGLLEGLRRHGNQGRKVNRTWGEPASQLHERHDASDFDTKTQDKLQGVSP